jgi:hypothetical protein
MTLSGPEPHKEGQAHFALLSVNLHSVAIFSQSLQLPTSSRVPKNQRKFQSSTAMPIGQQDSGATAGVRFVTSTIGNTIGGLTNLVGGVVGAASRGLGETIEGATGSAGRAVGRGIADAGTGIEGGSHRIAKGVKDAGYGK